MDVAAVVLNISGEFDYSIYKHSKKVSFFYGNPLIIEYISCLVMFTFRIFLLMPLFTSKLSFHTKIYSNFAFSKEITCSLSVKSRT